MFEGWHYQNAYICDDIEAGIGLIRARADIGEIPIIDVDHPLWTPQGMKRVASRLAFIWIGDLQYELIQPIADETGIYHNYKDNGGPLHFHHVCMRVDDWQGFTARVAQQDLPVVLKRESEGSPLNFLYLDARTVCGHYLEYVWCTDEMWAQLGPKG